MIEIANVFSFFFKNIEQVIGQIKTKISFTRLETPSWFQKDIYGIVFNILIPNHFELASYLCSYSYGY